MNGCNGDHSHDSSPSAVHALDTLSSGGGVFLVGDDVFVQELSKPGIRHREGGYGSVASVNEDGTFNVKYVHGELEKRVTIDRLSLSTLLFQSRGKRRKRSHAKDVFSDEFTSPANATTARASTSSNASSSSRITVPEPFRQSVSKLRQWINKVADIRGIDRVLANTEESSTEEHREPPQDLEDVLKKALAGLYVGWYDVRTKTLCAERLPTALAVIHWEVVGADISRMLEAAASLHPLGEAGHDTVDDVSAASHYVAAQVAQRLEHELGVQQSKIDEAVKKDTVKFLQERNGMAAVAGTWRKEPYPQRVYQPLRSYVAAEGISEEDQQEVLSLLDTPLNGFLGQPYNMDDQDMTEEWMVSFEDSKSKGVSDDDVIRTQIIALMDLLTAEVCDRVLNDVHILDVPPLALGQDVEEAPVWGVDSYTRRSIELAIKDALPAASQTMITKFIEELLVPAINAQSPTQAHDMAISLEAIINSSQAEQRWKDFAAATLASLQHYGDEHFRIHPKGTGVICRVQDGIPAHVFVTEYLGELYPPWRWCEKQDAIEFAQAHFNVKPTLPDFYNILLERPRMDPKGYGLLFVDASKKANLGSSCSHSCDSNCTTSVVARDGKLVIALHSVRPIQYGEELTMDYYSITTKEDEWRAAICLCGMRNCRESFLHFATMDDLQQIMHRSYGPMFRFASLLRACSKKALSDQDTAILKRHGIGEAALGNAPSLWALKYTAEVLRFVEFERKALPCALLRPANGQASLYTFSTADLDARSVMEQRLQSLVCSFSLINRFIKSQPKEKQRTQSPVRLLSQVEASERVWSLVQTLPQLLIESAEKVAGSRKSALEGFTEDQTNQLVGDMMVAASRVQELLDGPAPAHIPALKQNLRAVREVLLPLPAEPHPTARLGLLCDVLLLWASTTNFTAVQPYSTFNSVPVEVYAKDLGPRVPKSIIKKKERKSVAERTRPASPEVSGDAAAATAAVDEVLDQAADQQVPRAKKLATLATDDMENVNPSQANGTLAQHPEEEYFAPMDVVHTWRKHYSPSFVFSQLMCWFNNGQGNSSADVFGCVRLPLPSDCFGDGHSYTTKIREKLWKLLADDKKQTMPWPQEIKNCFSSHSTRKSQADQDLDHIFGSPMLDIALGNVSALDDVLRDMGSCLRAVSSDHQVLQWDNKLPPEVPTDWVQCDRCKKWRRLPWHVDVDSLPDPWFCDLNDWDPVTANCDAAQDCFDPERENTVQYTEGVIETYELGEWFDVYCLQNHVYYEARVVRVEKDRVMMHFKGWSTKYDESIEKGSTRIQPHNMFTKPGANPSQQEKYQAIHRPGAKEVEEVAQSSVTKKPKATPQKTRRGKAAPKKRKSSGKPTGQESSPKKERST